MKKKLLRITLSAMMVALSIVIAVAAKHIFGPNPLRVTFENLPIMLAGILLGPLWGGAVGLAADLVSCMFSGMTPFPLITVGSVVIGVASGVLYRYIIKRKNFLNLLASALTAHLLGSVTIKSIALMMMGYSFGIVVWRLPIYLAIGTAEAFVLSILLKNGYITNTFGWDNEK